MSGPLLDRIDLHVEVGRVGAEEILDTESERRGAEKRVSPAARARVIAARERAAARHRGTGLRSNAELGARDLHRYCPLDRDSLALVRGAVRHHGFSARACHRVVKVARTIADLAGSDTIRAEHVAEAIMYRTLDRTDAFSS